MDKQLGFYYIIELQRVSSDEYEIEYVFFTVYVAVLCLV